MSLTEGCFRQIRDKNAEEWLKSNYPMLKIISINGPFIYNLLPDNVRLYIIRNWHHPRNNNHGYYYEPDCYNRIMTNKSNKIVFIE